MEPKAPLSERQQRLQYHNEMKPVYKSILGMTVRGALKMMKWMVKAAFQIPGLVKKMSANQTEAARKSTARTKGSEIAQ
jgi:hypothetical protein